MRTMTAAFLLFSLASSARADISDSADLNLGGQAVIAGTVTVKGSAFSVGGATFTVLGGSVTVGGLFKPSTLGIRWADGSTSTSAYSSVGGDMLLAATQTVSGTKVFSSSITVGQGVFTTTASYASVIKGGVSEVAISTFSGASSVYFTNLYSSYTHIVALQVYQKTSNAIVKMQIDGNAGSVYRWAHRRELSDGTGENQSSGASSTSCQLTGNSSVKSAENANLSLRLYRNVGAVNDEMMGHSEVSFFLSDGLFAHFTGSCEYVPTSGGDGRISLNFFPSAGSWNGVIRIMAEVPTVEY
jgi:hypothetical protein